MNAVENLIRLITEKVHRQIFIPVEASGRHVHLSQDDLEKLFGPGHELTPVKDLSQPGQYASKERVKLTGPKGSLSNVVVLGPVRGKTQVEVSLTDARILGIDAPVRESGKTLDTPGVTLSTEYGQVQAPEGVIVALRHVHLTPEDAEKFGVRDKERVAVKVFGKRPLVFQEVLIRVSPQYASFMHIDYDEANACGHTPDTLGLIMKEG